MPLLLQKSKHLHSIPLSNGNFFTYHSLYRNPLIIDARTIKFLNLFKNPTSPDVLATKYAIREFSKWISLYRSKFYLVEMDQDERLGLSEFHNRMKEYLKNTPYFPSIGFTTGLVCNFACTYCMCHRLSDISNIPALGSNPPFDIDRACRVVEVYLNAMRTFRRQNASIGFSGGEPLIFWDTIRRIVEHTRQSFPDLQISFNINTNASLVDDKIAEYMAKNNFHVSLSLDGPNRKTNDAVRVFATKSGSTFDSIIAGVKTLRRHGLDVSGFYLTLVKDNFNIDIKELLEFVFKNEFRNLTVEPDLLGLDVATSEVVEKLISIEKACQEHGIRLIGFWKRPFENLTTRKQFPNNMAFCQALRGEIFAIDNAGRARVCAYSDHILGDASRMIEIRDSDSYLDVVSRNFIGNIKECNNCEIEGVCLGGCFLTREYARKMRDRHRFESRCFLYKKITMELIRLKHNNKKPANTRA